jgi:hypothetical protein
MAEDSDGAYSPRGPPAPGHGNPAHRRGLGRHDDQMTSDLTYERFADEYATHAVD